MYVRMGGRNYRVSRLVCLAFWGEAPEGKPIVAHKDDNRKNNCYENLFWTTQADNLDTEHFRETQKVKLFTRIRCIETGEIFES